MAKYHTGSFFPNPSEKKKDDQFIQKEYGLKRTSSHKLTIHVKEKELIGYTKFWMDICILTKKELFR